MESIFENEYERTYELLKEYYKTAYFRRPFFIVINIFFALSLLSQFVMLFLEHKNTVYYISMIIWTCVLFCVESFVYFRNIKLMIQRDSEQNKGKTPTVRTTVFESELRHENISSGGVSEFELCSIKKVFSTKNLIILETKAKLGIILSKSGFTKGSSEELILFLKEKGIKIS